MGGGRFFDSENVALKNIPFKIKLDGKRVTEIYFLMAIEGRRYQRCGFAEIYLDIHGQSMGCIVISNKK